MIERGTMTKKEGRKILKLIDQWTRAEIMARLGPVKNLEYADYYLMELEKEDEIRKLIYGTSSLVKLGNRLGLLRKGLKKKKNKDKKKHKKTR